MIVAEGAADSDGSKIDGDAVVQAMKEYNIEGRLTILGHVQRGGAPSALDRMLVCVQRCCGHHCTSVFLTQRTSTSPLNDIARRARAWVRKVSRPFSEMALWKSPSV